ncbi:MAG: clostripain-related cysteine peptidase [Actinomycetota bacterium]
MKKIINPRLVLIVMFLTSTLLFSCNSTKTTQSSVASTASAEITNSSSQQSTPSTTENASSSSVLITQSSEESIAAEEITRQPGSYTLMVYMTAADLESEDLNGFATDDLNEMMSAEDADHLNVVVETGGTKQWVNEKISNTENQRWFIENSSMELVSDNLGNRNMGDPGTLSDFINWSVKNYPADNYILLFWGSGSGSVYGYGNDEKHDDDSLVLPELEKALGDSVKKNNIELELVGFDSCLMATVETAYMASNYAKYFVASEETEPDHGWDYSQILSAISQNDTISGSQIGKVILDAYKEQSIAEETSDEITLSVVDLSKVSTIVDSIGDFASEAMTKIQNTEGLRALSLARNKAESYGEESDNSQCSDMVDLAGLMLNVREEYPTVSDELVNKIDDAVLYNLTSKIKPDARGLSIYMPYKDKENFDYNLADYNKINFSRPYLDFVKDYAQKISNSRDAVDFLDSSPEPVSGDEYTITIDKEYLDNVSEIYYQAGMTDGEYDTVLGEYNDVDYNKETGEITSRFDGQWLTMNGNLISIYFEKDYAGFKLYSIPAVLNGKDVDIMVSLDKNDIFKILGATETSNTDNGSSAKKPVKKGDSITPLFYSYDLDTDEESIVEGDAFTVKDTLELRYEDLPDGTYYYGYIVEDFAGNEIFSDFIEVEIAK